MEKQIKYLVKNPIFISYDQDFKPSTLNLNLTFDDEFDAFQAAKELAFTTHIKLRLLENQIYDRLKCEFEDDDSIIVTEETNYDKETLELLNEHLGNMHSCNINFMIDSKEDPKKIIPKAIKYYSGNEVSPDKKVLRSIVKSLEISTK